MLHAARDLLRSRATIPERAHRAAAMAVGTARAIEAFERPAWIYRARGAVPQVDLCFRDPVAVTDADVVLSRRLIAAHQLATADAPPPSGMWSDALFENRQRPLCEAVAAEDAPALAGLLTSMFRSEFVLGMAPGSLGLEQASASRRLAALRVLDRYVALAESQAAARVENPEQGSVAPAFVDGVEHLVSDLEGALDVRVDFPDVGAAYGISIAGRLITTDTPDQVYSAARIRDAIQAYVPVSDRQIQLVEIGAGYGAMAYWLLQMLHGLRYVIIDLPIVNVMQGYFLAKALGDSEISFYGEAEKRVAIAPAHAIASDNFLSRFDVLTNKDSMPEMSQSAVLEYLRWAQPRCSGFFYSYNQEAAAPVDGTPQNVVPELVSRVTGFTRIRRDASWLRRGYVEEIYDCRG